MVPNPSYSILQNVTLVTSKPALGLQAVTGLERVTLHMSPL